MCVNHNLMIASFSELACERSIFSKNHDYNNYIYKRVFRVAVNKHVPIFRGLDARGDIKLRTDTHTWDNYSI